MKFRFCGELDCPDWLLKEITVLSKISAVRFRLLCTQILNSILGGSVEYDKVIKLFKDANLENSDVKAAMAALRFILSNGAKYNVDEATLSNELQQIGLPKEHCDILARPYKDNRDKMRDKFLQTSLQLTQLESVDWRVDYLLSSSVLEEVNSPSVQLRINTKPTATAPSQSYAFNVDPDKLRVLIEELKAARDIMDAQGL
eukprot:TRINITY_DN32062_c0_g1_i1.p1 TRINITY_DN32062_c0_g1~~TRINITY_DN32062_c0_g1_i1.p1  ORF type:complete len:201 (-),score=51.63 TRINITY_DN32062_c0_g1_i1:47-649(-)